MHKRYFKGYAQWVNSYPLLVLRFLSAVAHRDYNSNASVEVRLFADRLEVWNPGMLPGTLTLESLHIDHPSVPFNPLIAESLYLARYIEKAGSGTQRMIELCREAGLPEPDYEIRQGSFVLTLWKDWLTETVLQTIDLNDRQNRAIAIIRQQGRVSNSEYQALTNATRTTAKRDLEDLVKKDVVVPAGRGRGAYYSFARKRLANGPNGPSNSQQGNGP